MLSRHDRLIAETGVPSSVAGTVRAAAQSVGCGYAVLYWLRADTLQPIYTHRVTVAAPFRLPDADWLTRSVGIDAIRVINDLSTLDALDHWPQFEAGDHADIRFMALVPVFDASSRALGLLMVADTDSQAGLSAAQMYALNTHAAALARIFDADVESAVGSNGELSPAQRLRLLESVFEHAYDAVLITEAEPIDRPGPRILYCNTAFTRTTGYSAAEVMGETPRILQSDRTSRKALDRLRAALAHWQPVELELLNRRKDGTDFWVALIIVPIANYDGRVTHWVSVQHDVTERKNLAKAANRLRVVEAENAALAAKLETQRVIERTLTYAVFHDPLTHLPNRAYIIDRLGALIKPVAPYEYAANPQASLLFLDMDGFKQVNDDLGHHAGDLLLMQMARRLETCVRGDDSVARVGGDEFVVLIERDSGHRAALDVVERILAVFDRPFRIIDQNILVSTSIGLVHIGNQYDAPEQPIHDADIAMYDAKQAGPGRYSLYSERIRQRTLDSLSLQDDLQKALADQKFSVSYQPIHSLAGSTCIGVEALARWHDASRGWISPNVFVPMAEKINAIQQLGDYVIQEACRQMRAWGLAAADLKLFVNVSARELCDPRFVDQLDVVLARNELSPERLQLDIKEGIFARDAARIERVLDALSSRGIGIALDDFGSGLSPLVYLDRYPINTLKIDRSFTTRMSSAPRTRAIGDGILSLGQALGMDIVAEGIETLDERDFLVSLGCRYGQGFLLAPPMTAEACATHLAIR